MSEPIVKEHRCEENKLVLLTERDWQSLPLDGVRGYRSARLTITSEYRTCPVCGSTMSRSEIR